MPSYSICGRSSLRPHLAKRTLRAGNGPMIVQAGLFAPKVAPPQDPPPQDPFYNRVTELDYFKAKFSGEAGFVTVLFGPRNCGKSVSSAFLCWSALPGQRQCFFPPFSFLLDDSFKHSSYNSFLFIISCRDCWMSFFNSTSSRILGHCSWKSTLASRQCVVQTRSPRRLSVN